MQKLPTIDEAGIIAARLSEKLWNAQEQAFFIAGFQEAIKYLMLERMPRSELIEDIQFAISKLMEHLDKYHDCEVGENIEGPPERKDLQDILYHLMGAITPNHGNLK